MVCVDAEHVALAGTTQVALDIPHAIDGVGGHPTKWHTRRDRALDHRRRQSRLRREADFARHIGCLQARRFVGPALGQIEGTIDEGMAVTRYVGGENTDLAIRDLARRTRILPRYATRSFALLQKVSSITSTASS